MKRIKFIQLSAFFVLFALLVRTGWFCLIKTEMLSSEAASQHSGLYTPEKRCNIYDRNMIPLTDSRPNPCIVIYPDRCDDLELISRLAGAQISGSAPVYCNLPTSYDEERLLLSQKGVYLTNRPARCLQNGMLSHVIGYVSDSNGSGLEKSLDKYLSNTDEINGIRLTIDYHMQEICEKALDNAQTNGAVVLADAKSGDILAMVSRPNYNPDNPASFLDSDNGELINRAITAYDVGSVFKIVITAAILSEGLVDADDTFACSGSCDITGKTFYCHYLPGHGSQTFAQAFANSCNMPFYSLGRELGMKRMYDYAKKLGFGSCVLNVDLDEATGSVPNEQYPTARSLANLSIGQGAIQVTPVQIAHLLCIISNKGMETPMNLVSSIVDKNNNEHKYRTLEKPQQLLSSDVCKKLLSFMKLTVENGTGTSAKPSNGTAAGKTGTAQTGWLKNGETMTHGWFAGVFPADEPKYVCVVFSENGKQGSTSSAPVFKEISEKIIHEYR